MHNRTLLIYWYFIGLVILIGSPAWADPIRVSGTGAAISTIKKVTDSCYQSHPDISFQFYLPPMGSSGAIKALATRQLDMALTGRPLQKEEESGELVQQWLGRSPFLFVVHQTSPMTHITMAQMADIYAGRQKVWPDGSRVRAILRPVADADTELMKNISPAMNEAITIAHARRLPGSAMADTDIELANMVERVPGSVGGLALTLVLAEHRPLRGLILDNVEPTVASLENDRYPYAKPLFLVTRSDAPAPVRVVADFLRSAEGKAALLSLGFSVTQP